MTSKADICNMALAHCQANRLISSFATDSGKEADLLRRYYDTALKEVLEAANWGFARAEVPLALAAGESSGEWQRVYHWPVNMLKLRYLMAAADTPWEVALHSNGTEKVILCDLDNARAVFTRLVTATPLFTGAFTQALALNLAQWICGPLTDDAGRQQRLLQRFMLQIGKAAALDSAQDNAREAEKMPDARWIHDRGGQVAGYGSGGGW